MRGTSQPATLYCASTPRLSGYFPDSKYDQLWIADVKACIPGGTCRVFKNVMLVESQETVYIYGVEHENGRPKEVKAELADSQQSFVDFVREQDELMESAMGILAPVFEGSEYACQARATAAYMIHREHLRYLALGYRNREGEYIREKLEDPEDWLDHARAILPLDKMEASEA